MPEILILADDLTGAADCAAGFASHGLDTILRLRDSDDEPPSQVLAVDLETRRMAPQAAAAAAAQAIDGNPRLLYKKIDSTLRGHIGVELAAVLKAWRLDYPGAPLVLAPAFPSMGRFTRGGRQFVHGEQLPHDLPAMIPSLRTSLITLDDLRAGGNPFEKYADVHLCDAETEEDLRAIARATAEYQPQAVWCGSAGLARHTCEALGLASRPRRPIPRARGPLLIASGSPSSVGREQARLLEDVSDDLLLTIPSDLGGLVEDPALCAELAQRAVRHTGQFGGLILTGGDTARAVLDAFGVAWLRVLGEIEPGVPVSVTDLGIPVITKAGAFGDAGTLIRCRAALK